MHMISCQLVMFDDINTFTHTCTSYDVVMFDDVNAFSHASIETGTIEAS